MKITLIQPPKPYYGSIAETHWELTRPLSLFTLAAFLKKHTDFNVNIIDFEKKQFRGVSIDNVIGNEKSDIFGITATTYTRFEAIKIAECIKNRHPDSLVVAGGVHFSFCAKDALANVPWIDVIVRGEGESALFELSGAFNEKKDFSRISGITYRQGGEIIENIRRDLSEDIDSIPLYTDFKWEDYPEYVFFYPEPVKAVGIISARGCPYRCIFCSKAASEYRARKAKNVVNEIEIMRDMFKIEGVNFLDLTFAASPVHSTEICNEIIKRKLNLKWWCETRVNIPQKLLCLMKEAGCVSIAVGIETGSPEILSRISKGISIQDVVDFCRKCAGLGIIVKPYFMFSHPGETKKQSEETLALMNKLEKFTGICSFQPAMIFPGTELENIARKKNILPDSFSWSGEYKSKLNEDLGQLVNIPLFIDKMTPQDLKGLMKERERMLEKYDRRQNIKDFAQYSADIPARQLLSRFISAFKEQKQSLILINSPVFFIKYAAIKLNRILTALKKKMFLILLKSGFYGNIMKIFSHLSNDEKYELFRLARGVRENGVIVEIGSYLGASSCFLALGARRNGNTVYCIDTWKNEGMSEGPRDTYGEFLNNVRAFSNIIALRIKSEEVAVCFDKKIDLLFIDGGHSYESCRGDIKAWLPHLNKNAAVAFHDYADWAPGVKKAVDECIRPVQKKKENIVRSLYYTIV